MDEENRLGFGGIALLLALAAITVALFTRSSPVATETTLERVRRTGAIRIGYANEAPYGYLDNASGDVIGEAPETAKAILRRMGVDRVEAVVTDFGSLIPALKAGRFDIIAAGMYITPERCREIAFTNPTYAIGEAFIVRRGNPLDLHSFSSVAEHPAARLGFVGGTVEHDYAQHAGIPEERIVIFPDNVSGLAAVRTGRVDAFAATTLTVIDLLQKASDDELEQAEPFQDPIIDGRTARGYGAFGVRRGDADLVEELNRQLAGFLGTKEHLDLVRPFGFTEATLPGEVTARELCAQR